MLKENNREQVNNISHECGSNLRLQSGLKPTNMIKIREVQSCPEYQGW
jgi:hypothetical protein